jgi:hypothetical protein
MLIICSLTRRERHELQTHLPLSRIELRECPQFGLLGLHSVLITAAAWNPIDTIATTINGHSTTNQKEIFQSGFSEVDFRFMHFLKRSKTDISGNL